MSSWMHVSAGKPADYEIDWRVNGGPSHAFKYDAAQLAYFGSQPASGAMPLVFDVPVGELKSGVNTLELAAKNVPLSYPPVVFNVDLVAAPN